MRISFSIFSAKYIYFDIKLQFKLNIFIFLGLFEKNYIKIIYIYNKKNRKLFIYTRTHYIINNNFYMILHQIFAQNRFIECNRIYHCFQIHSNNKSQKPFFFGFKS